MMKRRTTRWLGLSLAGMLCAVICQYGGIREAKAACNAPDGTEITADMISPVCTIVRTGIPSDFLPYHYLYSFNDAGVCSVDCVVIVSPNSADVQTYLAGKITWTIDGVQGTTPSWANGGVAQYNSIDQVWSDMAIFTGMPEHNSSFGRKNATYTLGDLGCSDTRIAKIFFKRDAKNHPGYASGTTPNWYYYWIEGAVVKGLNTFGYTDENLSGKFDPNTGNLYVCKKAPYDDTEHTVSHQRWIPDDSIDPPQYDATAKMWKGKANLRPTWKIGRTASGIDLCASTLVHEMMHKENWQLCHAGGNRDADHDGCPDSKEGGPPYYLCQGLKDTYGMDNEFPSQGYDQSGDNEFLAWRAEQDPGPAPDATDATKDWSDTNGKNYNHGP